MGPDAARIAVDVDAADLNEITYFKNARAHIAGKPVRAARMSYVGEAVWELTCRAHDADPVYTALVAVGAMPADLYAQTSMRIEKGFRAMGRELDGDVTPIAARLHVAVRKKGGFIGAAALTKAQQAGATAHIITVVFDDPSTVPPGYEPIYLDGAIVGETSSAAYGYCIDAPLALGHVRVPVDDGQAVDVDIAGARMTCRIVTGPAFDPKGERMKSATPSDTA